MRYNKIWPATRQPEELVKQAEIYSKKKKWSKAEFTRMAVKFFLDKFNF